MWSLRQQTLSPSGQSMVTSATDTEVSQVTVWSLQQQTLQSVKSLCGHFSNIHYEQSQSVQRMIASATDTTVSQVTVWSLQQQTLQSVRSLCGHFSNRHYSQSGHCVVTSAYSVVNRRQSGHSVINRHLSQSQVIVWSTDI